MSFAGLTQSQLDEAWRARSLDCESPFLDRVMDELRIEASEQGLGDLNESELETWLEERLGQILTPPCFLITVLYCGTNHTRMHAVHGSPADWIAERHTPVPPKTKYGHDVGLVSRNDLPVLLNSERITQAQHDSLSGIL